MERMQKEYRALAGRAVNSNQTKASNTAECSIAMSHGLSLSRRNATAASAVSGKYVAYRFSRESEPTPELPRGYEMEIWRPALLSITPPTLTWRFVAWWLFHYIGVMSSHKYCVLLIRSGGRVVHRSCLVPKYYRWPFMDDDDLQISSTWTHPDHRCRGLAKFAVQYFVREHGASARDLWYIAKPENAASIAVCRSCHFEFAAHLRRTKRWGSLFLGSFISAAPGDREAYSMKASQVRGVIQ